MATSLGALWVRDAGKDTPYKQRKYDSNMIPHNDDDDHDDDDDDVYCNKPAT